MLQILSKFSEQVLSFFKSLLLRLYIGDYPSKAQDEDMQDEFKMMRLVSVKNRYNSETIG